MGFQPMGRGTPRRSVGTPAEESRYSALRPRDICPRVRMEVTTRATEPHPRDRRIQSTMTPRLRTLATLALSLTFFVAPSRAADAPPSPPPGPGVAMTFGNGPLGS